MGKPRRKVIKTNIYGEDLDLNLPLERVIELCQKLLNKYKRQGWDKVEFEEEYDYDGTTDLILVVTRRETEEEYETRLKIWEAEAARRKVQREIDKKKRAAELKARKETKIEELELEIKKLRRKLNP